MFFSVPLVSQNSDIAIVNQITVSGNKITRDFIITRELPFKANDTVMRSGLDHLMAHAKENVFNTNLFNLVDVKFDTVSGSLFVDITVTVIERWYIWPIPYVQPADRNFNVWLATRDISRVTYGVNLTFKNMRGRRETLKLPLYFGYNLQFGLDYTFPFVNKNQTIGLAFGGNISFTHEVAVKTSGDKPVFLNLEKDYIQELAKLSARVAYRPDLYIFHQLGLEYMYYQFKPVLDSVEGFLMEPTSNLSFVNLSWQFKSDHRDVHFYPLKGYYLDFTLNHAIPFKLTHNSYLLSHSKLFQPVKGRVYFATSLAAKISLTKKQPYLLQRGLGYGQDYIRGFEYYVIDGQHYALLKVQLKYAVVPWHVTHLNFIGSEKFNTFPWAIYMNLFSDIGYVYQYPESKQKSMLPNTLNNNILSGFGLGVDFASYYDIVIRMETTLSSIGEAGFFIHFIAPI
jgi:outer membrane protein assembly factor BamA